MISERLPRTYRLLSKADFQRVRGGQSVRGRFLVVRWRATERGNPRFGLAVSRKVGNAVVRNRVKRWLREIVRHDGKSLSPLDVVIIARPGAGDAGLSALNAELHTAFLCMGAA